MKDLYKLYSIALFKILFLFSALSAESIPYFSTGVKIGEVSENSAIVWTRLTSVSSPDFDNLNSAPGSRGSVQVSYWVQNLEKNQILLDPVVVDEAADFTSQIHLKALTPNTHYSLQLSAFSTEGSPGETIRASFKTAPAQDQVADVCAVVVTCQGHETIDKPKKGHWAYSHMRRQDPDFFIHTGDVVYYDRWEAMPLSKNKTQARQRWNKMFSYAWNQEFHKQVSSYFMKDDHDTLKNDCWPGQVYGELTWDDGLQLFKEQTPQGPLPYRKVRWGKDLEFWMMEGRDFRSANTIPDSPNKTILGKAQKEWLKKTVLESDATFKLIVFPSPVVGPDKKGKSDNHSNLGFKNEGDELRQFIASIPNAFVVCGDRHWQYASKDPETGLTEICCGPINNAHSKRGGNANGNPDYHLYYGGGKGGYLRLNIKRENGTPKIHFVWHGDITTNGKINHELSFLAKSANP